MMIPLYGRFKGENGYRWHCLPISDRSRSGIPHTLWLGRLMARRVNMQGMRNRWFFQRGMGRKARISDFDPDILYYMGLLHERSPELFSVGTLLEKKIAEEVDEARGNPGSHGPGKRCHHSP